MKTGIELIQQERQEQIEKHGYSKEFQEANMQWYSNRQLIQAGNFCVFPDSLDWPFNWDTSARDKIIQKSRIGQLACAGAFYLAHEELFGYSHPLKRDIEFCAEEIDKILQSKTQPPSPL
jgi:hypothetical protein